MSYNLLLEGKVDYDEWAAITVRFGTFEIFPAPSTSDGVLDALGVAIPLGIVEQDPASAADDLRRLRDEARRGSLTVWDLVQGKRLVADEDWQSLVSEVCG